MARKKAGRRTFGATRQLPSGKWQASYKGPDGKRRVAPTTFVTATDANNWLTGIEHSISNGKWKSPEVMAEELAEEAAKKAAEEAAQSENAMTFGEYGDRWLRHRPKLRPRTKELYELLWRLWLKPEMGSVTLDSMTPLVWREWYARSLQTHPGSTQPDRAFRLARAILSTAVEDNLVESNPCRVKGAGKDTASKRTVATEEQVQAIANAIGPEYQAMVLIAAYQGLRFGELAGLRRRSVNLLHLELAVHEQAIELAGGKVIFGDPKTEAGIRELAIVDALVPYLEKHLAEQVDADPGALLFTSPQGHPLRRTKFRPRWVAACAATGVSGLRFHDLRHTALTWAAQDGATTAELMFMAGHKTSEVAMRYQQAVKERDKELAKRRSARLMAVTIAPESPPAAVAATP